MAIKRKSRESRESREKAARAPPAAQTPAAGPVSAAGFPVVGIGASAGGLAALETFFSSMPTDVDPGMAFVIVQHLAPDHKSILTEIIQRNLNSFNGQGSNCVFNMFSTAPKKNCFCNFQLQARCGKIGALQSAEQFFRKLSALEFGRGGVDGYMSKRDPSVSPASHVRNDAQNHSIADFR